MSDALGLRQTSLTNLKAASVHRSNASRCIPEMNECMCELQYQIRTLKMKTPSSFVGERSV